MEKWIPMGNRCHTCNRPSGGIRRDLFGCIDILVLDGQQGVLGLQVTTRSNISTRAKKAIGACGEDLAVWFECGNRFEVWGFGRPTPKNRRWSLIRIGINYDGTVFSQQEVGL